MLLPRCRRHHPDRPGRRPLPRHRGGPAVERRPGTAAARRRCLVSRCLGMSTARLQRSWCSRVLLPHTSHAQHLLTTAHPPPVQAKRMIEDIIAGGDPFGHGGEHPLTARAGSPWCSRAASRPACPAGPRPGLPSALAACGAACACPPRSPADSPHLRPLCVQGPAALAARPSAARPLVRPAALAPRPLARPLVLPTAASPLMVASRRTAVLLVRAFWDIFEA